MKLAIAKEQILQGLQAVQNVVGSRTTLPILSNVLLKAVDNRVELTATDLDVTVSCCVDATVKTPGSTTIPVKKFFGICRELGHFEIDLETDERHVCTLSPAIRIIASTAWRRRISLLCPSLPTNGMWSCLRRS